MVNLQMWRDNDNFQLYDSIHTLKIYRNGEIYLYGISLSEWLFEMHQIPNINVLELSKYFETEMLKSKCCWNPGWWYLMLLRKVARYIGLEWGVFTFSLSQVARNNAVKGKQKNTISFLYNFKHCNLVAKQS